MEPSVAAHVHHLLDKAYLFDDPEAYEAGVRDAAELLTEALAAREVA
jgi:hypothetical protein